MTPYHTCPITMITMEARPAMPSPTVNFLQYPVYSYRFLSLAYTLVVPACGVVTPASLEPADARGGPARAAAARAAGYCTVARAS